MRLGQLSRKLGVKSNEIVAFISKEFNEEIKEHPNCKIPDDFVSRIEDHFSVSPEEPDQTEIKKRADKLEELNEPESSISSSDIPKTEVDEEIVEVFEEETQKVESTTTDFEEERLGNDSSVEEKAGHETERNIQDEVVADLETTDKPLTDEDLNIVDGIIKAPSVKPQELKVVGKIELPEKSVEEEVEEIDQEKESIPVTDSPEIDDLEAEDIKVVEEKTEEKEPEVKKTEPKKPSKEKAPVKKKSSKEESYDKQKERELEKYRKEQEKKKKLEKEAKRKNYEELIKEKQKKHPKKANKSKKKKENKKKTAEITEKIKKEEEVPTSLWGKFIRWLNT